jgi:hypothetical protein
MRKIILFAIAALVLIGIGAWTGTRALTPASAVAGSYNRPVMMTGAKGLPTSHDDYDLVAY